MNALCLKYHSFSPPIESRLKCHPLIINQLLTRMTACEKWLRPKSDQPNLTPHWCWRLWWASTGQPTAGAGACGGHSQVGMEPCPSVSLRFSATCPASTGGSCSGRVLVQRGSWSGGSASPLPIWGRDSHSRPNHRGHCCSPCRSVSCHSGVGSSKHGLNWETERERGLWSSDYGKQSQNDKQVGLDRRQKNIAG